MTGPMGNMLGVVCVLTGCTMTIEGRSDDDPTGAPDDTGGSADASPASDAPPPEPFSLTDSLRGQAGTGTLVGGEITADGWKVTSRTDRIYWTLPSLADGSIEFTVTGMSEANMPLNDHEIFTMYEGGHGIAEPIEYNPEYRNNYFKTMIRVYGVAEAERTGLQKLLWVNCAGGAPGHGDCPCGRSFLEEPFDGDPTWDGSPQRLRVEWTRDRGARLLRNGVEVVSLDWAASTHFGPTALHFALGSARADSVDTAGMPIGAVFSDVQVNGTVGEPLAACN